MRSRRRRRRRRRISRVFIFFFSGATCAALRDVKRHPLCGSASSSLPLISIAITPHTQKISDALARGGTHPNMHPAHTTVLTAHTTLYSPFSIASKKKRKRNKWVSSIPRREYPLFPLFSLISPCSTLLIFTSPSLILLRACVSLSTSMHVLECVCVCVCVAMVFGQCSV